jgi:pSer/pThr/pTyr-binding forkhead associated (FHA) protein
MPVELIITQGSNAGTVAPIHQGYYLVGRHKECQIRPKSRSVSRRHCLLLHNEDGFGLLDLKSTGGTYVNGKRLEPHRWKVLGDGDQIRFGRIAFSVSIQQPALVSTGDAVAERNTSAAASVGPAATPHSWQNVEVAEFLQSEDQAEFETRYRDRRNHRDIATDATSRPSAPASMASIEDSGVLSDPEIESARSHDTFVGELREELKEAEETERAVEVDSVPKKRPPHRKIDHDAYKRAPKRSLTLPSFAGAGSTVDWKLAGMFSLVCLAIGVLGYQVYRFQSGPNIQVRENLD